MSEYDCANFEEVYKGTGGSLLESVEITEVPWEIGAPQPIVCDILKSEKPGKLLDVGCGLGRNAKAASDLGFEVIAIDNAATAIQHCQKNFPDTNISFRVLDACHTELEPIFDIILDSATYHAIPKNLRLAYLQEMQRLTSKNTVFHLITFAPSSYGMPKPLAVELSELAGNAEQSGFDIKLVEKVEYKGNATAIKEFSKKKNLNIKTDEIGRTKLPAWHLILTRYESLSG